MDKETQAQAESRQGGAAEAAPAAAPSAPANGHDAGKKPSASSRTRAASPRKARHAQKKPTKTEAGDGIASPRQQVGQGSTKPELQKQYRKLEQMEKIATKTKKMPSEAAGSGAAPAQPPVQELVAPHEWDMLLNAFEENGMTPTSQPRPAPGQIEIDAEDLWEKLSSTRWLKAHKADESARASTSSPDDPSNKTTVANR